MGERAVQLDFTGTETAVGDDPEMPGGKQCCKCKLIKPRSEFYREGLRRDGLTTYCKTCMRVKTRAWQRENHERYRETNRRYAKTPEGRKVNRRARLKAKYDLTLEEYDAMLKAQGNRCAICRSDDPRSRGGVFSIDHDHRTGKVRELLCQNCNGALGLVNDSISVLATMIAYLGKHAPS